MEVKASSSVICYVIMWSVLPLLPDANAKSPLHFAYITTFTGGPLASSSIPAVDLALEEINKRDDILRNYTLSYIPAVDSGCNRTASLDAFFNIIDDDVTIVALLGCGCSSATLPVAEIIHYWNIPQIAHAAAAVELSDRIRYRNFFRTVPTLRHMAESLVQLMREFGWNQMAVITENDRVFMETTDSLIIIANTENKSLDTSLLINTDIHVNPFPYDEIFNTISENNYKIIHINGYHTMAYKILCEAYHRQMYAPEYVWILPMWYNYNWWSKFVASSDSSRNASCTNDCIIQVLNGSIGTVPVGYFPSDKDTIQTISGNNFTVIYEELLTHNQYKNYSEFGLIGLAYDAAWSIAVALDKTVNKISMGNDSGCEDKSGDMVPLEYFNYTNEKLGCIMKQSFSEVMFTGVTGNIQFDVNGSRPDNSLLVKQYRISSNKTIRRDTIGIITVRDGNSSVFAFSIKESNNTIWTNGKLPYDGFPIEEIHTNDLALVVVYNFIALCGIGFAIVCFIFNIVFRNKKIVKLASPNLNYLIILGSVILFCCVFFYTYSSSDSAVQAGFCNTRTWLFSIGYTLCFAVILSKALRIYYIFNNPKPQKKALKDKVLLPPIISIVAIGLVIILVGSAIPQSRLMSFKHEDLEHMQEINDEGKIVHYSIYKCNQDGSIIWLAVSFGYKALLQLVAMFMAFHTRRVKVKALNDSKEIAVIIYINSIILTLLIVTEFALDGYHNAHAALFGLGLLIDGFLFLGLIFIPKVLCFSLTLQSLSKNCKAKRHVVVVWFNCKYMHMYIALNDSTCPQLDHKPQQRRFALQFSLKDCKMISLYKDPKGDNVFSHSLAISAGADYTSKKSHTHDISEEAVSVLRARVKELETKLNNQEVTVIDGDLVSNGEI